MVRTSRALFSVGVVIFFFLLVHPAWAILSGKEQPGGNIASDDTTHRFVIIFKDHTTPRIPAILSWLKDQHFGVYLQPLFTTTRVGPSFVGEEDMKKSFHHIALAPAAQAQSPAGYPTDFQAGIAATVADAGARFFVPNASLILGQVVTYGTGLKWQGSQTCGGQFGFSANLNVSGAVVGTNCLTGGGNAPYYFDSGAAMSPANIAANPIRTFTLQNVPMGYTCSGWTGIVTNSISGNTQVGTLNGSGCTATIDFSRFANQAGTTSLDYHLWFVISPAPGLSIAPTPYPVRGPATGLRVYARTASSLLGGQTQFWQSQPGCGGQFSIANGLSVAYQYGGGQNQPITTCDPYAPYADINLSGTTVFPGPSTSPYILQNLPVGYTCGTWIDEVWNAVTGVYIETRSGVGCSADVHWDPYIVTGGLPASEARDHFVTYFILPLSRSVVNLSAPLPTPAPVQSTLAETGLPCQVGAVSSCGVSNILVCDMNTNSRQNVCKIPACVGKDCIGTAPSSSSFVSNEIHNIYTAEIYPIIDGASPSSGADPISIGNLTSALINAFPDDIAYIEPDLRLHFQASSPDPYYDLQWNLRRIGWDEVPRDFGSQTQVKVGIVDTGVMMDHEEFSSRIFGPARDFALCASFGSGDMCATNRTCTGVSDGYCSDTAQDDNGHGTHITGVITAMIGNNKGVSGMSNAVQIIPIKVMNQAGDTLESWTYEGIVYAVNQGAKVVNVSIGGCAADPSADGRCPHTMHTISKGFQKVLDYAVRRGVTVVAAAGNENDDAQWYTPVNYNISPATAGKIIVVGSTNALDRRSSFSNYGLVVDIAAPGGDVLTDKNGDGIVSTDDCDPGQCILSSINLRDHHRFSDPWYESEAGTSMSAPHVVAEAALLLAKNPSLTVGQIRDAIISHADPISSDKVVGKRINIKKALDSVTEASNVQYVDPECDLCGWCNQQKDPKPSHWDACHACMFDMQERLTNKTYTMLGCFAKTPIGMVQRIFAYVLVGSGGIAFLAFLSGSVMVLMSAGNPEKVRAGKEAIVSSIVGILVILFSILILKIIGVQILQIPGFLG